jgi:hypothetical protein
MGYEPPTHGRARRVPVAGIVPLGSPESFGGVGCADAWRG